MIKETAEGLNAKRTRTSPDNREKSRMKTAEMDVKEEHKTCEPASLRDIALLLEKAIAPLSTKEDIQALRDEIKSLKDENAELQKGIGRLETSYNVLENRIEELEIKERRHNLVFIGFSPPQDGDLKRYVTEVCSGTLKVDIHPENICAVFQIGKLGKERRPLLVTFSTVQEKMKILKSASSLRATGCSIQEDLPASVRIKKTKLLRLRKEIRRRRSNIKVGVRGQFLYVEETRFSWCPRVGLQYNGEIGVMKLNEVVGDNFCEFCAILKDEQLVEPQRT